MSPPDISVVVCTWNRAEVLPGCLDALIAQTLPQDSYEVLVVDNGSTDATPDVVQAYSRFDWSLRYVHEARLGLSNARNAGTRAADGRYVAFIDDDARACGDWLEHLLAAFETVDPTPAAVGGEIDPVWGAPPPPWLTRKFHHFLSVDLGWSETARFIEPPEWICETNSTYRADILAELGPWPDDLGRKGQSLLSNEAIINDAIHAAGEKIYFEPAARVRHLVSRERLTKDWMLRRFFWQGVSEAVIDLHHQDDTRGLDFFGLPHDVRHWHALLGEDAPDELIFEACCRVHHVGYFLRKTGVIPG